MKSYFLKEISKLREIGESYVLKNSGLKPEQVRNSISHFGRRKVSNPEQKVFSSRSLPDGSYIITLTKKGV